MKTIKSLILALTISFSSLLMAQSKSIQTEKSTLEWTGKAAFNSYSLTGSLDLKMGSLNIENDSVRALEITVDMTSLNHENNTLKSHLRSEDFFEVSTYKDATFKLSNSSPIKDGIAKITGYLTIKDTTKQETFQISFNEDYSRLSFEIDIDRTSYGVTFNSPSFYEKLKEDAIADVFRLKGNVLLR